MRTPRSNALEHVCIFCKKDGNRFEKNTIRTIGVIFLSIRAFQYYFEIGVLREKELVFLWKSYGIFETPSIIEITTENQSIILCQNSGRRSSKEHSISIRDSEKGL